MEPTGNKLKDFSVRRNAEKEVTHYCFRFGKCEDFPQALDDLKEYIPRGQRSYSQDQDHLWIIQANDENETALGEIFDNFDDCLEIAEAQMAMF
jgi:hypothetical protein